MEETLSEGIERAAHLQATKVHNIRPTDRLELINQLLGAQEVDLQALSRLAVEGFPPNLKVRALAWQLLLGYLPPQRCEWEDILKQRHEGVVRNCTKDKRMDDEPLSEEADSAWAAYFRDLEDFEQIKRDLERTHQTIPFFCCEDLGASNHLEELQRLLFVFSKLNSGLKYVQGMNELVAPLYMVFKTDAPDDAAAARAEMDTFFCFIRLLTVSENRDLYCKTLDAATSGVAHVMKAFMQQLAVADPTIGAHLVGEKVDPHFFAFRWMTVLFSQDIEPLEDVLRVWDFLLGDPHGCKDAIMRFCCALLLRRRIQLLAVGFPEIIKVLQNCGREDFNVEETINIATSLSSQYIL